MSSREEQAKLFGEAISKFCSEQGISEAEFIMSAIVEIENGAFKFLLESLEKHAEVGWDVGFVKELLESLIKDNERAWKRLVKRAWKESIEKNNSEIKE